MTTINRSNELYSSQIPALKTLMSLGWQYLSPADCLKKRDDTRSVILRDVLIEILQQRRYEYKGEWHSLSANAIEQILRDLSSPGLNEGLLTASERIYERLCLGITVTEFINGKKHSPTIAVIDWDDITANSFIVTEEFTVSSTNGTHSCRPDMVCFVNGLPLVVIEAKRATSTTGKDTIDDAISQMLRNQRVDEIPALFVYSQLLLAVNSVDGRYGTTQTKDKFWAKWKEEEFTDADFEKVVNTALATEAKAILFAKRNPESEAFFEQLWAGSLLPSAQDRLLISLLTPERLLEFVRYFILYDKKVDKIAARYPQVFGVKALLKRVVQHAENGKRKGGVLWHTTGSGKSFTMVLFCKALLMQSALKDSRIIVVTDRTDLEQQLSNTFISGGAFGSLLATKKDGEHARVGSGKDLAKRIGQGNERIIFTIINKFNNASKQPECFNPSDMVIVLIDEGHRSQGGENHVRMRKTLPNAAYVAFTGTPLLKNDKTTNQFGPIVHAYTMQNAVADGTVAPLLYEQRQLDLDVNVHAIDNWFERFTTPLSEKQKADMKKKFSRKGAIYKSENRIAMIAWDIADHFSSKIKKETPGLKGQLACDSKLSAIRYKKHLDATGKVTSAVIISSPDTREGHTDVDEASLPAVQQWWKDHVNYDNENYERNTMSNFGSDGEPDILIVVDKLLTGFDEPRNCVLYIDKPLKDHNLIQAVARVNRLHKHKKFGLLIDYRGILDELDTAVKKFQDLAERSQSGYDIDDIVGLYQNVSVEYKKLPNLHTAIWAIFSGVKNKLDSEQLREVLIPRYAEDKDGHSYDSHEKVRNEFYAALTDFGLCLSLALSSCSFFEDSSFSEKKVYLYKSDLKSFVQLRAEVRRDAQETVDFSSYEEQVRNLVGQHVIGNDISEPDGKYDIAALGQQKPENWSTEKTRNETDLIRTRIKRTIDQDLTGDPYAQQVFSELLKAAIAEAEALFEHPDKQYALFNNFEDNLNQRNIDGIPESLNKSRLAKNFYGLMKIVMGEAYFESLEEDELQTFVNEAFAIEEIIELSVTEHSLNTQSMEADINQKLIPRLFKLIGIDRSRELIKQIIHTIRTVRSRGDL